MSTSGGSWARWKVSMFAFAAARASFSAAGMSRGGCGAHVGRNFERPGIAPLDAAGDFAQRAVAAGFYVGEDFGHLSRDLLLFPGEALGEGGPLGAFGIVVDFQNFHDGSGFLADHVFECQDQDALRPRSP